VDRLKLIILDRDGTLNVDRDDYVTSPAEWQPIPGALDAVARLTQAGWHAVVATNQSGLGRGLFDMATLNAMHLKLNELLATAGGRLDAIFFCPHVPSDGCDCRKPLPGLFLQIGERYGVDLKGVPAVGDTLRDLQAAAAAGCEPHLVLTGKAGDMTEAQQAEVLAQVPGAIAHPNLSAFADFVIRRDRAARGKGDSEGSVRGGLG
jgi:D-glycero-D-manno-heptose 1,7-bisphosphate phosphatase